MTRIKYLSEFYDCSPSYSPYALYQDFSRYVILCA